MRLRLPKPRCNKSLERLRGTLRWTPQFGFEVKLGHPCQRLIWDTSESGRLRCTVDADAPQLGEM